MRRERNAKQKFQEKIAGTYFGDNKNSTMV